MFKNQRAFSSFSVDDLGKAKKFYAGVLGLQVTTQPEGLALHLEGGGDVFIYLSTDYQAPDHTVLNFLVDDVSAALAALAKKGVRPEHYDLPGMTTDDDGIWRNDSGTGPEEIAWFKDPAGHVLAVLTERTSGRGGKKSEGKVAAKKVARAGAKGGERKEKAAKRPARGTRRK